VAARRTLIAIGAALTVTLAGAFSDRPHPAPAPLATLDVVFAGCASVGRGPVCFLTGQRRLHLWLPVPPGLDDELRSDGDLVSFTDRGPLSLAWTRSGDDGVSADAVVTADTASLTIERRQGHQPLARWRLALADLPRDPLLDEAEQRRHIDAAGADELLAAALANEIDPDRRARIGALRARIALSRGHIEEAVAGLRAAFEAARRAGRVAEAVHDGFALVHTLIMDRLAFADGKDVLAQLASLIRSYPESGAELAYYEGLLGLQAGDLRASLRAFEIAARDARRLGLTALEGYADTQHAIALAVLGRGGEALALGRQAADRAKALSRDPHQLPCNRSAAEVDLAWIALIVWRGDQGSTPEPGPLLARADQALAREGCTDPTWRWNMALNQTLFAIARGDISAARRRLAALAPQTGPPPSPYLATWADETEGRLAFASGQLRRAVKVFAHEAALARAAGFLDGLLRAEIGTGRALLRLGRRADAAIHLGAARDTLEELLRSVPLGEGRDSFLQSHDESSQFLIDALVQLGRDRDAFTVARLTRVRALAALTQSARLSALSASDRRRWDDALAAYRAGRAALEQEAEGDWQLPSDQLAHVREQRRDRERRVRAHLDEAYQVLQGPEDSTLASPLAWPAPDDLYVTYVATERGWLALLATARGVVSRPLPGATAPLTGAPVALSARLLSPLASELSLARRVRFFPPGALGDTDLHALPFAGRPLADTLAVEYGVDVSVSRSAVATSRSSPFLIVDDPTEDLGAARIEANAIQTAINARVVRRLEAADATRERVLQALPLARAFHYAGHGSYAGVEGLESALPLAGGGRLLAGDLLALTSVPEVVTLSACEAAGRSAPDAVSVPLGIAEAFLASGAAAVVAPSRAVTDEVAGQVMRSLYRELARRGAGTNPSFLAAALGDAEREVRRDEPRADWSAFRVLIR
jgi:hypothetical protein